MAERNTHGTGQHGGLANDVKTAVHGFTGVGEAIRGTVNSGVDQLFHNKESNASVAKNDAIANKGIHDVEALEERVGHGAGAHGVGHTTTTTSPSSTTATAGAASDGFGQSHAGTTAHTTATMDHHGQHGATGQGSHFAGH